MKQQAVKVNRAKQLLFVFALGLLMATSGPVSAQFLPTTHPGPHAAQVSGGLGQSIQDIYGVTFVGIDGRNIQARRELWLEPGRYELTVVIDAAFFRSPRPGIRRSQIQRGANKIEVELEAGKTYEIRGLFNREKPVNEAFSVIVWRVSG